MKKLLMGLSLIMGLCGPMAAQHLSYGFNLGVNGGTPYTKPEEGATGSPGLGMALGPFLRFSFNDRFSLEVEAMYSRKKAQFSTPVTDQDYTYYQDMVFPDTTITLVVETVFNGDVEGNFDLEYLEMPLLGWYHTSGNFSFGIGPYAAYLLDGANSGTATGIVGDNFTTIEDEPFDNAEYLRTWDFGTSLAVNYETEAGINLSLRFNRGLTSVYRKDYPQATAPVRNTYLQFLLGYRFRHS